ncbi:MAG: hypothetical protein GY750_09850 [Lentisphaerae bacterium]|nr:hypothetical protein [Lentisphaerota bacterium]
MTESKFQYCAWCGVSDGLDHLPGCPSQGITFNGVRNQAAEREWTEMKLLTASQLVNVAGAALEELKRRSENASQLANKTG